MDEIVVSVRELPDGKHIAHFPTFYCDYLNGILRYTNEVNLSYEIEDDIWSGDMIHSSGWDDIPHEDVLEMIEETKLPEVAKQLKDSLYDPSGMRRGDWKLVCHADMSSEVVEYGMTPSRDIARAEEHTRNNIGQKSDDHTFPRSRQ